MGKKYYEESRELFQMLERCLGDEHYLLMGYFTEQQFDHTKISKNMVERFNLPDSTIDDFFSCWSELIHPDDLTGFLQDFKYLLQGDTKIHDFEYRAKDKNDNYVWMNCRLMFDEEGTGFYAGNLTNLGYEGKFDQLTNLLNGTSFEKDLQSLEENKERAAIYIVDIHNFSLYNERYTHSFGDKILHYFATMLKKVCNENTKVYRLESDKFCFIQENGTKMDVERTFARIQKLSSSGGVIDGINVNMSVVGGALQFPEDGRKASEVRRNLDYALSESKNNPHCELTFFDQDILQGFLKRIQLLEALNGSIHNEFDGFSVKYQPIVRDDSGKAIGSEVLLRYHSDVLGEISPSEFIPILDKEESIVSVGYWILEHALRQQKIWQQYDPDFKMSINVSYIQFLNQDFIDNAIMLYRKYEPTRGSVIFELTENCDSKNISALRDDINRLRAESIHVALDDFETEHASMNVLQQLDFDYIKISQYFVTNLKESGVDRDIFEYIIGLCKKLHIPVCVEGIENRDIYAIVSRYKPELYQGYYFARPSTVEEFERKYFPHK